MTCESWIIGAKVDFDLADLELRESLETAVEYNWEKVATSQLKVSVWLEDSSETVINPLPGYG
jgi:hypothetical protein